MVNVVINNDTKYEPDETFFAQLVNASDGYQVWSKRYDRDVEDVFEIQEEIARNIVNQLRIKLTAAQDKALGKRHTESVEAYELYLRGRHCWYRWNMKGMLEKAIHHYKQDNNC